MSTTLAVFYTASTATASAADSFHHLHTGPAPALRCKPHHHHECASQALYSTSLRHAQLGATHRQGRCRCSTSPPGAQGAGGSQAAAPGSRCCRRLQAQAGSLHVSNVAVLLCTQLARRLQRVAHPEPRMVLLPAGTLE
jgi:hypothetical protein